MGLVVFLKLSLALEAFPGFSVGVDGFLGSTSILSAKPGTNKVARVEFPISLSASGSSSNAGKGDDTIKELNKLDSIVIDPLLVNDPAFWDYCLVPNEQGPMQLGVLQAIGNDDTNNDDDFCSRLIGCGGDADDIAFYQETYEVFEKGLVAGPSAGGVQSGLVVRADTLQSMPQQARSSFSKVIRVLRGEDEGGRCVEDDDVGDGGNVSADIEVSSLGELRALTICSYAYLTKRS